MSKKMLNRHEDGTETREVVTFSKGNRKVVSALQKFLLEIPLQDMLEFLKTIGVHYSLVGMSYSKYVENEFVFRIFIQQGTGFSGKNVKNVAEYIGTSRFEMKLAVCNAFADFLINEDHDGHDYHDYIAEYKRKELDIKSINNAIETLEQKAPHMLIDNYTTTDLFKGEQSNE